MKAGLAPKLLMAFSAVSGTAATVTTVVNVVEQVNVVNMHEAVVTDNYQINGVDVTAEEYQAFVNGTKVYAVTGVEAYYGAVTNPLSIEFDSLTKVSVASESNVYTSTFSLSCGTDAPDYLSQYPVFVVASSYTVDSFAEHGITSSVGRYTASSWTVTYLSTARYDADLGGSEYTVSFH